ncbi:MFS transporter, partial [bacterium]
MGSWAPLVPLVKARLSLDEAQLGSLLLCLGLGSVMAMPFSGGWAGRFGCRFVILVAGAIAVAMVPAFAFVPSTALMAVSLLLFGAGIGTVDVVMNIQAVIVEKASGRSMMSGFHGLFSV